MKKITQLAFVLTLLSLPVNAHQMFREDPKNVTTFVNREEFSLKNNYEFPAEFKVEVFDKDMAPAASEEWRSNLRDNTIRMLPAAIKDITVNFKPSKEERKYYVCTRLTDGQDVVIELYSRICLRLVVKPTLGADS